VKLAQPDLTSQLIKIEIFGNVLFREDSLTGIYLYVSTIGASTPNAR